MIHLLRRIKSIIPNTLTCCNLLSGCVAIIMSFSSTEHFGCLTGAQWAYIMIGCAAAFDFADGASARLLKAYSLIGKELDSLSDLVSFGVAPATLMYNLMTEDSQYPWIAWITLMIPVCGALRLAKFNVDQNQATTFTGLPIPANALFWIGMGGFVTRYGYPGDAVMCVLTVLLSLAMVCRVRMFSLKFKDFKLRSNFRRYVLLLAAAVFLCIYGVAGLAWTILLYMLIAFFGRKQEE